MPLMIGIQRPSDSINSENDVLSHFPPHNDDYIFIQNEKIGYSLFEQFDYVVFR